MLAKSERTLSLNSCWTALSIAAFLVIAPMVAGSSANAANFSFTPIEVPGAPLQSLKTSTTRGRSLGILATARVQPRLPRHRRQLHPNRCARRINYNRLSASTTRGRSSGLFSDSTGAHGFLNTGGSFTQIDVPGAIDLRTLRYQRRGADRRFFCDSTSGHGFLDTGGSFTTFDVPGASITEAHSINDAGQIVGFFNDSTGWPRLPRHRRQLHPNRRAGRNLYAGLRHQ